MRPRRKDRDGPRVLSLDGLHAVDEGAWDRLVPSGGATLRHGFLRAWERCELPGLRSRPLVVPGKADDGLLAAAAAYLYDLDLASVQQLASPSLLQSVRRVRPRFMTARVLEVGAPAARVDPVLLGEDDAAESAAAAIIDAAIAEAASAGASLTIVQDHVSPATPLARALRARGFAAVPTLPTAILEHGYDSFDEYLGALRSKYRNRARRIMRESRYLGVERIEDFGALAQPFASLWRLVHERATETKREILGEPFFEAVASLPNVVALVLRRGDDSIAAFGLLLEDAPWLHFLQCGFTTEAGRDEAAYRRLLLEVVRSGIDGGFRFVHLGCTTLEPKLALGAVPLPLHAWIRHRKASMNLGCRLGARLLRQAVPQPHHVFAGRR
jgi:predicted N-acyltransferase